MPCGSPAANAMIRWISICLCLLLMASHPAAVGAAPDEAGGSYELVVVEQLRLKVPSESRQAWLKAEAGSWEPWLNQQQGFLGRQLLWDPEREEGTLLIRWESRRQWKAIPEAELAAVQQRFEQLARSATATEAGNPFPLVFEGELQPL